MNQYAHENMENFTGFDTTSSAPISFIEVNDNISVTTSGGK
jgi:hypothetical protein